MRKQNNGQLEGKSIVELRGVAKSFRSPAGEFAALRGIDLRMDAGEFVAIVGKSGSGKSTLLHMIAGIDRPSEGEVIVDGEPVHVMGQEQMAAWRGRKVGVVFQFFQLLPTLTVLENVMLPMDFCGAYTPRERRPRALQLLEQFGIQDQAHKVPAMLSGGQQQRAAMARALANDPVILVADEPTGNLDSETTSQVLELFAALTKNGKTVVMVTHERDISRWADRTVTLADGRIVVQSAPGAVES